jgi:hypothetical protein
VQKVVGLEEIHKIMTARQQIYYALDRLYYPSWNLPEHAPPAVTSYIRQDENGIYYLVKKGNATVKQYINP